MIHFYFIFQKKFGCRKMVIINNNLNMLKILSLQKGSLFIFYFFRSNLKKKNFFFWAVVNKII